MKQFLLKLLKLLPILLIIMFVNYRMDPAKVFVKDYEKKAVELLLEGRNVAGMTDYNERLFQKIFIESEKIPPETVILGSSRVMEMTSGTVGYKNCRNYGMSGAGIYDYYGILGLLYQNEKMPERIIIGVDPWLFNRKSGEERYKALNKEIAIFEKLVGIETKQDIIYESLKRKLQIISIPYFQASVGKLKRDPTCLFRDSYDFYATTNSNAKEMIRFPDGSIDESIEDREILEKDSILRAKQYISGNVYQIENYEELDHDLRRRFEKMVSYLQKEKIEVILYLPPYHPIVFEYLKDNQNYQEVMNAWEYFINYASREQLKIYGSYDPKLLGCKNHYFIDGMHLKRKYMDKAWRLIE